MPSPPFFFVLEGVSRTAAPGDASTSRHLVAHLRTRGDGRAASGPPAPYRGPRRVEPATVNQPLQNVEPQVTDRGEYSDRPAQLLSIIPAVGNGANRH